MNKVLEVQQEALIDLHLEYISKGAEIITTNTFKTQPLHCNKFG